MVTQKMQGLSSELVMGHSLNLMSEIFQPLKTIVKKDQCQWLLLMLLLQSECLLVAGFFRLLERKNDILHQQRRRNIPT